jgi:hypothetical protein
MAKYKMTIVKTDTDEVVKEIEFNSIIGGASNEENNQQIILLDDTYGNCALAIRAANRAIKTAYADDNGTLEHLVAVISDVEVPEEEEE